MNYTKKDTCLIVAVVAIAGMAMLAVVMGLSIAVTACIAMVVCNWALPMFDIDFPITFAQGCGIGVIVLAFRACVQGIKVNVKE